MIEKLDIINTQVYCYDMQFILIKTLEISQFQDVDFGFLGLYKMATFNVNQPIKRIVKFMELNDLGITAEFAEYIYDNMTPEQQSSFDSFVAQAEIL